MNQALKNRLVGVAVLSLIAAIVWPLLFRFDSSSIHIDDEELLSEADSINKKIAELREETKHIQQQVLGSNQQQLEQDRQSLSDEIAKHPDLKLPNSSENIGVFNPADRVASNSADQRRSPAELDSQGVPVSWIVQVASFRRWENANSLREKLIDAGYKAFQRPEDSSFVGPYAIYVGPTFEKSKSVSMASDIEERFNTGESIIKRFKGGLR